MEHCCSWRNELAWRKAGHFYLFFLLFVIVQCGFAQKSMVQVKTFDQQLKPLKNIEISINGKPFIKIGNKGDAFVELEDKELPLKSIKIKDEQLEAASWNYSKGIVEVIVRKKSYQLVKFILKDQFNGAVPDVDVTFRGTNTYHARSTQSGRFELPLPLDERVQAASQFLVNGHNILRLTLSEPERILVVEKIVVEKPIEQEPVIAKAPVVQQELIRDFSLAQIDSIQSLTMFWSVFKNIPIKNLPDDTRRRVDAKFFSLMRAQEDSIKRKEVTFIGRISDSSFVKDDISNLLQQARIESKTLDAQRMDFDQKIKLITEKLSGGMENLDTKTRDNLLNDLAMLEDLLEENENRFYRNLSDYRQIINSLKEKYFDYQDLENKLTASEARRQKELQAFRQKLIITISVSVLFAFMIVLLIIFGSKLRKQKLKLEQANEEINMINENLEELVQERTKELEEAHRELDTFLYRASHDLRSPVCSIIGLCNLASRFSSEEAKDILDMVVNTTTNMDRLLKKLTIISEINAPSEYSVIRVRETLDEMQASVKGLAHEHNITVKVDCKPELQFYSYPGLFQAITTNLLENAIFYTSLKNTKEKRVAVTAATRDDKLILTVEDNGIGIDDKMKEKVFNMFFKGTVYSKGNGLGLYIVQKSVNALDGTIALESVHGEFSKFVVTLPLRGKRHHSLTSQKISEVQALAFN
jgi:signal transduction histidine kinase